MLVYCYVRVNVDEERAFFSFSQDLFLMPGPFLSALWVCLYKTICVDGTQTEEGFYSIFTSRAWETWLSVQIFSIVIVDLFYRKYQVDSYYQGKMFTIRVVNVLRIRPSWICAFVFQMIYIVFCAIHTTFQLKWKRIKILISSYIVNNMQIFQIVFKKQLYIMYILVRKDIKHFSLVFAAWVHQLLFLRRKCMKKSSRRTITIKLFSEHFPRFFQSSCLYWVTHDFVSML